MGFGEKFLSDSAIRSRAIFSCCGASSTLIFGSESESLLRSCTAVMRSHISVEVSELKVAL